MSEDAKLLDEIIASFTQAEEPVARVLRRCLVLAYRLKNDKLKRWLERELNGYEATDDIPDYRNSGGVAKGLLLGPMGAAIQDQPLPTHVLKEEHRHFAQGVALRQPIAAYEGANFNENSMIPWPADLVLLYQGKFMEGYALNRAWQEIPASAIVGLVDSVRTRILTFALELKDQIGDPESDKASLDRLGPTAVERIFNVTIIGGANVLGDVNELKIAAVGVGDLESLRSALVALGITDLEMESLEANLKLDADAKTPSSPLSIGPRTNTWIAETTNKLASAGLKLGNVAAEEAIKQLIRGFLGN